MGFAIPTNMVQVVVASARSGGQRRRAALARRQACKQLTPELSQAVSICKRPAGVRSSPALHRQWPGGPRRAEGWRRHRLGRRARTVDDPNAFDYRFTTHAARRQVSSSACVRAGQGEQGRAGGAASPRRKGTARRDRDSIGRSPFLRRQGRQSFRRRWPTSCRLRNSSRQGVVVVDIADRILWPSSLGFQRGDVVDRGQRRQRIAKTRDLEKAARAPCRPVVGASPSCAAGSRFPRCSADDLARPSAAQGRACSRPRASKRMRRGRSPTGCGRDAREVVGQHHLLGPDGALRRMMASAGSAR